MCFVTHNRLIVIIAGLSIIIGTMTSVSSALVIHNADDLALVTIHFQFLIACTFFTIGAGIIQAVSSLLYICRRIVTTHWIRTNAIVFGILLVGMSVAMVRFQSTLPAGFDPKVVVNRTEHSHMLQIRSAQLQLNTIDDQSPKQKESEETNSVNIVIPEDLNESEEVETTTTADPQVGGPTAGPKVDLSVTDSSVDVLVTNPPVSKPVTDPPVSEPVTDPNFGVPVTNDNEDGNSDGDKKLTREELEELVTRKGHLLKFYFGVVIVNFLALPIFLGLVSSKASKYDLKWRSRIEYW